MMNEAREQTKDALTREWKTKILLLKARAVRKATAAQKGRYFRYIDSLQARQNDIRDIVQRLQAAGDLQG